MFIKEEKYFTIFHFTFIRVKASDICRKTASLQENAKQNAEICIQIINNFNKAKFLFLIALFMSFLQLK